MRKLTLGLVLAICLLASQALAAWTVTGTVYRTYKLGDGAEVLVVRLTCTSDADASGALPLSTYLTASQLNSIKGGYLYAIEADPGAAPNAPTGTYTISVTNSLGTTIFSKAGWSTSTTEMVSGADTIGIFPCIHDGGSVTITTLGDTKTSVIYVSIAR